MTDIAHDPRLDSIAANHGKLFKSMRYFLLGLLEAANLPGMPEKQREQLLKFRISLDALEYAAELHDGTRKDGTTPEFQHQLEIAHLLRTHMRYLRHPAETLAAAFLHDTPEDKGIKHGELKERFGVLVADAAVRLSKYEADGTPKDLDRYYMVDLAECPICSGVKGGDNSHNQSTMPGVFSFPKQYDYASKIKERGWAMLKKARRLHPDQEALYESLKYTLRIQYNGTMTMLRELQFDPDTGAIHPALSS